MTAPDAVSTRPPFEAVAKVVWRDVPFVIGRLSPAVGKAARNRAGWIDRFPPLAAAIAPAALVIGGLIGAFHWGCPSSYSSSALVVAILLALACACGAGVGLWITLGYAVGDFALYSHPYALADTPVNVIGLRLGLLVSYVGLYLLLVQLPVTASSARTAVAAKAQNEALGKGSHLVVAAAFAFLWTQSVPVLLRPMYVWAPLPFGKVPPIGAINPVQSNGVVFAIVALVFSIGAVMVGETHGQHQGPEPPPLLASLGPLQGFVQAFVSGALFTLMFSGLASSWVEFAVLYALIQIAALLRLAVLPLVPGYAREVAKVPMAVRIAFPILMGMASGYVLIAVVFADNDLQRTVLSFMPVIISLGIGMIAGAIAMPVALSPRANPT